MTQWPFSIPDELTLIDFFEVEPVESSPKDGYWCYEVKDKKDTRLRISLNAIERSLRTEIYFGDHFVLRLEQEGGVRLKVEKYKDGPLLIGEFDFRGAQSTVRVKVKPDIFIDTGTLLRYEKG